MKAVGQRWRFGRTPGLREEPDARRDSDRRSHPLGSRWRRQDQKRASAKVLWRDSGCCRVPPLQRGRGTGGTGSHRPRRQSEARSRGRRSPGRSPRRGRGAVIAVEVEKLSLYGKPVTADDLPLLVPDARQSTIFALVNALGRKDRARSLETLDTLVREGEYLPLALTFLATQFRMALVAKEASLRGASQVQRHFQRAGVPMWGSRAEQVWQTASKFSQRSTRTRPDADLRSGPRSAQRAPRRPHGNGKLRRQTLRVTSASSRATRPAIPK